MCVNNTKGKSTFVSMIQKVTQLRRTVSVRTFPTSFSFCLVKFSSNKPKMPVLYSDNIIISMCYRIAFFTDNDVIKVRQLSQCR